MTTFIIISSLINSRARVDHCYTSVAKRVARVRPQPALPRGLRYASKNKSAVKNKLVPSSNIPCGLDNISYPHPEQFRRSEVEKLCTVSCRLL